MVITTVSLNPAIDKTYTVSGFKPDAVNRAHKVKTNIGGKGINVASIGRICGLDSIATGFVSGANGVYIENELHKIDVETDFVHTSGETRINIKIADPENNTFTDINDSGSGVTLQNIEDIYKKTDKIAKRSECMYIGGSVPPGACVEIYKKLIKISKDNGALTVLDAEGEVFKKGIEAKPDIIKPNKFELELLMGRKLETINDVCDVAVEIMTRGVNTVLVSLGGDGAVAVSKNGIYRAFSLKVPVRSTVGAGDSFLMGYIYGLAQNQSFENSLKYAISFASAKIQTEGTDLPSHSEFISGFNDVIIEKIG